MKEALEREGLKYFWLGNLLGGFREGGYKSYMGTDEYREGIRRLVEIARNHRAAVMCAEKYWFRCHRRFISLTLTEMGWDVIHITD